MSSNGAGQHQLAEEASENVLTNALVRYVPGLPNAYTLVRNQVSGSSRQPVVQRIFDLARQIVRALVEAEQAPGGIP